MITLSTGETITEAEWQRRVKEQQAKVATYWATHPEEAAQTQRRYIETMQRDLNKD